MSHMLTLIRLLVPFLIFISTAAAGETEEHYYAIEQKGVIFGYAHVVITRTEFAGRPAVQVLDSNWMQMSALSQSFEATFRFEYRVDPADGMYFYHTSAIEQGGMKIGGIMDVRGDSIYIKSDPGGDSGAIALLPGTILQNTRIFTYLIDYFVTDTQTTKDGLLFSEMSGKIDSVTYTSRGREQLALAGKTYDALRVDVLDRTSGIHSKLWVDASTGLLLKSMHPFRDTYLIDESIKERVSRADLNDYLFAHVDTVIADPLGISYMKVKATLQPGGLWLTPGGLNVPGQKFEGTVENNRVDGIFEISHARYDGLNASPFPHDFSGVDSLIPYLNPGDMIESNDPALMAKAKEIAAGSADIWTAATRLSRWVSEEIGYDIPGGGSALHTFNTRLGDCGSHSYLLAAFCRAVGIPSRVVFGCLYVPQYGGGFGQHGWNEVYMGSAGWIPVDATAREIDYVDCSHIRLGEVVSRATMFNPVKMEILDYRLTGSSATDQGASAASAAYDAFIGKYQGERGELALVVHNGSLGLDIPGRNMIFELKDPDENGHWFFKLSDAGSVSFERDTSGATMALTIHERQRLPKRPVADSAAAEIAIPDEYRPLIGEYTMPMQNSGLAIVFPSDQLSLQLPSGRTIPLRESEMPGQWLVDKSPNTTLVLSFDADEAGQVVAMRLTSLSRCPKIVEAGSQH